MIYNNYYLILFILVFFTACRLIKRRSFMKQVISLTLTSLFLIVCGCSDSSNPVSDLQTKSDLVLDVGLSKDGPATDLPNVDSKSPTPDSVSLDIISDISCLKPGAIPGPSCSTKQNCEDAKYSPCTQKCMGCGCACYLGKCYDLRDILTCK